MYKVVGILVAIVVLVWSALKLKKSEKFDKFAEELTTDHDFSTPETKDVIEKIGKAETGLGERAKEQKEEAKKLTEESDSIGEYLDSRAVKHDDDVKTVKEG